MHIGDEEKESASLEAVTKLKKKKQKANCLGLVEL